MAGTDKLAETLAEAIREAIREEVSKELRRMSLHTADAARAAFIDALAQTHSGHPTKNRVAVRQRANELTLQKSG